MAVCVIFVIRLFQLQIIKHDFYVNEARNIQHKEYLIPAERGVIRAHNGSATAPLVLNETKYTLYADPVYVEDVDKAALEISNILKLDANEIRGKLQTENTRYVILAKKLSKEQSESISKLGLKGIGTRDQVYRTYPQGAVGSQVLGFVNDEGEGQYGVEQYMDGRLGGVPGELRAITDHQGVPLVSNPDNVIIEPQAGESFTLSLDIGMQSRLEELLKKRTKLSRSPGASAVIMDPNSGAIKAMANYPSYDPRKLDKVGDDLSVLSNAAISRPLEIGSIMKSFTVAAGLEEGVIAPNTAFYDEGFVKIGDHTITDVSASRGTQTVESTMVHSLNTGAIWVLKQIGRGSINERARLTWHKYMDEKFYFGHLSGVEQAGESPGVVPSPEDTGQGVDVTYATTTFGQAMTANLVQVAAAFSALVNGGTYYQPHLVEVVHKDGKDQYVQPVIKGQVISAETSSQMRSLLETVRRENNFAAGRDGYSVGSKSGTAEFINPETGKYRTDRYHGTYTGFIGGDKPEYVVVVLVREPGVPGNAGYTSAGPLFADVSNMLIDNFGVTPKGQ